MKLLLSILIISTILMISNFCTAKPIIRNRPPMIHLHEGGDEWVQERANSLTINKRIKESAVEYMNKWAVVRFANYDLGLPADSKEYIDLDKNAVVMIAALTHNKDELPLKRVYIDYLGEEVVLEKLLSKVSKVEDDIVRNVFGNYREDSFYLLPIHFLMKNCKLVIDWTKNRKGFILAEYPTNVDFDYIRKDENPDKRNLQLNEESLKEFLKREYSVIFK